MDDDGPRLLSSRQGRPSFYSMQSCAVWPLYPSRTFPSVLDRNLGTRTPACYSRSRKPSETLFDGTHRARARPTTDATPPKSHVVARTKKAQMLLGADTSDPEFWNVSKTDQRSIESARKSVSSTGSVYCSLEENKSFPRVDTTLDVLPLEHSKRRTRGIPSLSRAEAFSIRSSSTRATLGQDILQSRSTSTLKFHNDPHNTPTCLQNLRPVTPGVRKMDIWRGIPSNPELSSRHGRQHNSQHGHQRNSDASASAALHDNRAMSSPSKRSMKSDIRKLFSRQSPFHPITASPAQTMHIPGISRNNQDLQFVPLGSSIATRSASPPGTGERRPSSVRGRHTKESLGDTGSNQYLHQMSYQSSGEHQKIHVRRPPRGAKEWFDALSDDDDDNDDAIITHKSDSEKLSVPITTMSDQLNDKVLFEPPRGIMKARDTSVYSEPLEMLEAGDHCRKPVASPRNIFGRKSSEIIGTQEMESIVRNSLILSKRSPGEGTSTSTKTSINKKKSIRPRTSFQEGQSTLDLSDSDESELQSPGVICEAAWVNVPLAGCAKMVRRKQQITSAPRSPSYNAYALLTTQRFVENDSSASSNHRLSSSAPTTVDPCSSARTSWVSNIQTAFPAESSPSSETHPPRHMARTVSLNTPQKQCTAQQTAHHVGTGSDQRLMAVTQEEALFLANMRRKRTIVENQMFSGYFASGIEQELRKLEQLQAQALSTLELSKEITEVQRMLDPAPTADQQERQYFSGHCRLSSTGTIREVTVENDHEHKHEHEPKSVSVQTAKFPKFPSPPRARPLRRSQETTEKHPSTPSQLAPHPTSVPPRPSTDTAEDPSLEPNTPQSLPTPTPPPSLPTPPPPPATRLRKPKKRASYPYKLFPDITTTTPSPRQSSMPLQQSSPPPDAMPRQFSMPLQHSLPTPDATPRASLCASVLAPG